MLHAFFTHTALVSPDGLGKRFRALVLDDVPPTLGAGLTRVDDLTLVILDRRYKSVSLETGFASLTGDGRSVDGHITEVSEQLLRSVLGPNESEQLGCVIDEGRPGLAVFKDFMGKKPDEEGDVGLQGVIDKTTTSNKSATDLHTADSEFHQSSDHFPSSDLIRGAAA